VLRWRRPWLDDADTCRKASGDDSIAACSRLLARNPKDAGAHYSRGYVYEWRKGDHDRAIANFDQAIVLNPKYALAYADRGFSHEHKGEWDRAFADFDQAIRFDPRLPGAYNGRANVYKQRGEYDRAIADYDQALRLNPKFVVVYSNRGGVYASKGDHDRAIADFDQAIQLDPKLVVAYTGRGNAYDHKGDQSGGNRTEKLPSRNASIAASMRLDRASVAPASLDRPALAVRVCFGSGLRASFRRAGSSRRSRFQRYGVMMLRSRDAVPIRRTTRRGSLARGCAPGLLLAPNDAIASSTRSRWPAYRAKIAAKQREETP
jgi:Tfp pilus assembly protein PilF